MNDLDNIKEGVDVGVKQVTVDIPVRVTMLSTDDAPFEFVPSIDEVGQIILTPSSLGMQFETANIDSNIDFDIPVAEQETTIEDRGVGKAKTTSILLKADMLCEVNNFDVSADVDSIGQCVIYPSNNKNTFVSAVIVDNSINLITEDMNKEYYFGYTLLNTGDGWDIYDATNELIDEGVATLAEAKIVACTTELHRLEELTEDLQSSETTEDSTEEQDAVDFSEVESEVIEESIVDLNNPPPEFTEEEINDALITITDNFTTNEGTIKCDTINERTTCMKVLQNKYKDVSTENHDKYSVIMFSNKIEEQLVEEFDRKSIIDKFMQGELTILSDSGVPNDSLIHMNELDSNGYAYYYDSDSGVMITYPIYEA